MLLAYSLRPATPADFPFMCETKLEGMRPYVEAVWGWSRTDQEQLFREKFDAERSRIVIVDGVDAGFIHVVEDTDAIFLVGIFLSAATRRQGIGSAIIRDLIVQAERDGKSLRLRVLKTNPAQHLYRRLGFRTTGETKAHLLMTWTKPTAN